MTRVRRGKPQGVLSWIDDNTNMASFGTLSPVSPHLQSHRSLPSPQANRRLEVGSPSKVAAKSGYFHLPDISDRIEILPTERDRHHAMHTPGLYGTIGQH